MKEPTSNDYANNNPSKGNVKQFIEKIELLTEYPSLLSNLFTNLSTEFKAQHDNYCEWLMETITKIFKFHPGAQKAQESDGPEVIKLKLLDQLVDMGIDWLTMHYKTRHPIEGWSKYGEWVQEGAPIQYDEACQENQKPHEDQKGRSPLGKYSHILKVYAGTRSPYISYFSQKVVKKGEPVRILLQKDGADSVEDWLCVNESLVNYIITETDEKTEEGDFTEDEVIKCKESAAKSGEKEVIENIRNTFSELADKEDISDAEALGMFRNSCRVTLLALKQNDKEITLPRVVVLVPFYVEENVIGGIAFVGSKKVSILDTKILKYLADTLLSNIRLREEGLREVEISYAEELNRARADFVQRVTHSIQNPLESLQISVDKFADSLEIIKQSVGDLRSTSGELLLAFSSKKVEDILRVNKVVFNLSEFFKTLVFRNQGIFEARGVTLEVFPISPDWNISADKTAFWQVMSNLLDNARIYAREKVRVYVERIASPDIRYVFHIIDDGPGIDPSIREDLFKPGVSTKNKTGHEKKVHGFGLYLSSQVVKKHGGTISLNKNVDKGTEFIIEIPG
jgi:signal transduction histidine kinase